MLFYCSAIIQSAIGVLIIIFGFSLLFDRCKKDSSYYFDFQLAAGTGGITGIAGGAVICVAGGLGIASYCIKDPQNYCKNGFHMAFSILAWLASGVGISIFSLGVL